MLLRDGSYPGSPRAARLVCFCLAPSLLACVLAPATGSEPVVPGSGIRIDAVGDDLEEPGWQYSNNAPKSSRNIDKRERGPLGQSQNGRWLEGPHRGTPDLVQRVDTPPGGLAGSTGSLLIRTSNAGIPSMRTMEPQQDDLMVKVQRRLGQLIPPSLSPNCVVRVYVPPFEEWENRTGSSFGFRIDCWGSKPGQGQLEQYWPGMFINFRSETSRRFKDDSAFLTIRGDVNGRDIRGPEITPGWWTLGMSVTPDGKCHFYAREGIDDLRSEDRLASYYCYGFRCQRFDLFFFNVVAMDNGATWSTPWIIDDPTFYCAEALIARSPKSRSKVHRR